MNNKIIISNFNLIVTIFNIFESNKIKTTSISIYIQRYTIIYIKYLYL